MLVFIDESGDSGFKIGKGSSRFFIIALVVFENTEAAIECDTSISALKRQLSWSPDHEFHFRRDSDKIRRSFLSTAAACRFTYHAVVIRKNVEMERIHRNKDTFYSFACSVVFQNAKKHLKDAKVIIDKSGNLDFRNYLATFLRKKMNTHERILHKIKMQNSHHNQLIQLADYIAGALHCSIQQKHKFHTIYRGMVRQREEDVVFYETKTADPIPERERER